MRTSISLVHTVDELPHGLVAVADAQAASPFTTLAWYGVLAGTALTDEQSARFLVSSSADESGMSAAVLPYVSVNTPSGRSSLIGLTSYYHPKFDVISFGVRADEHRERALAVFAEKALASDIVDFSPLAESDTGIRVHLARALSRRGFFVDCYVYGNNWTLQLGEESFAEYFSTRSSRLVNTIVRKTKRLQKSPGFSIRIFDAPDANLEPAIADFLAVYAASWKNPEPFPEFIPELCRLAAGQGWLRLGIMRVADQPAAAQLWLVHAGKAYIFKLAYDERYSKYSAGSILTAEMMRRIIDIDHCRAIDFCTGDDAYKKDWMNQRCSLLGLIAFNPRSVRGITAAFRHFGGKLLKRLGFCREGLFRG